MLSRLTQTFFVISVLLPVLALGTSQPRSDEDIESNYHPTYAKLATGDFHKWLLKSRAQEKYKWPVQLKSIGNSIASYQRYGSVSGAYFHHGLDMRADAGSPVLAARGGKVIDIVNYEPGQDMYWEIAIQDEDGFIWQYHHVDRDSMPQEIFDAKNNGTPIAAGTKLGEVYYWPVVSEGERYHHVHLNILGKNKEYLNPFAFLEPLPDKSAPVIRDISIVQDGDKVQNQDVSGDYTIAAEVGDLVLSKAFYLPPYDLKVSVDGASPFTVWRFDTLPGGSSDKKYVNDFFIPRLACGDYECRHPVIDLGFEPGNHRAFPNGSGTHQLVLTASDFAGNTTTQTFSWTVR